jgi:tRNA(Ile)-lysidine synthase
VPVEAWGGLLRAAATALSDGSTIGVAASGGGDSLAALYLLRAVGAQVAVATVDHGLRDESAAEAAWVSQACAGLGVPHDILLWRAGPQGSGNLMEQARAARYAMLADWAQKQGIGRVVLGHTADDQAETFLMALARGTGLDGLVGMRPSFQQCGITFLRPFLDITRTDLRSYLQAQKLSWLDDPSNDNPRFARTHARQALAALQPLGVTLPKILTTMRNLRQSQAALREAVAMACGRCIQEVAGSVVVDAGAFGGLAEDVQHRLIADVVQWLSGDIHPPRADGIARVRAALMAEGSATLAGCRLHNGRFLREAKAATAEQPTTTLWDNRWRVTGPHAPDLTIRALDDGIRQCPDWRATGLSREVLIVTPAIWRGAALIAAPLAGMPNGWTAEIAQSLHAFILSH